ncbi:hypothetical protein PR202_ga23708 [Eleusine coracana subsp. coracana]|uniref:Thioester reductase (TE) domain-containing protein n=1 Tax=Eleusine coracana subsp. coracana TaxID=191504 RepID=A0AAV5D797_ELECO|nr:hypothetical protein PR202_ga23708 [Eleusine coracana subsp. coracana]
MWMGWEKKKTACVTGGSGYIASALIKMLLEKGYAVKTTVRNPGISTVWSFFEMIEPAVRGTLNVLRSCAKAGTVRRVVFTSSAAAVCIRPLQGDGHVLDEESCSDLDYVTAEKPQAWAREKSYIYEKKKCLQGYVLAKVLSEKEAFRFAQEKGISLVTLFPGLTVGASPAPKAKTSVPCALSLLSGDEAALNALKGLETSHGCVPVVGLDDLCRAHVFVAETEAASGRYLCCGFNTTVGEMARFLAEKYPQYFSDGFGDLLDKPRLCLSSVKLVREGFEFKVKTLDDMYDDELVEYGKALGILPY